MKRSSREQETASHSVTILDIAHHVKMSRTTVSAALNGNGRLNQQTRDLVLQAARDLDYHPNNYARSLRRKNSGEILLFAENIQHELLTHKMTLIQQRLSEHGLNAPIYACSQGDEKPNNQHLLLASLAQRQPRAIVCKFATITTKSRDILLQLEANGTVVVCYDSEIDDLNLDQIVFDHFDSSYQAAKCLLQLGHRAIGLVNFGNDPIASLRRNGFECALREVGLTPNSQWLYDGAMRNPMVIPELVGVRAAAYFAGLPNRPTGICVLNDLMALAFIGELGRFGLRVTQDMSVIGTGDLLICEFGPIKLSSVSHPVEIIADTVVQRVLERFSEELMLGFISRMSKPSFGVLSRNPE